MRLKESLGIFLCYGTAEMDPINGPGLVRIGSITMRMIGRKDKYFIGIYSIAMAIQHIPSGTICTVNQNKLFNAVRTGYLMVFSFWIVSYSSNMQQT